MQPREGTPQDSKSPGVGEVFSFVYVGDEIDIVATIDGYDCRLERVANERAAKEFVKNFMEMQPND